MDNLARFIVDNYDNPKALESVIINKIVAAAHRTIGEIKIEEREFEDEEFAKLCKYYKQVETENDLLYISSNSWKRTPQTFKNTIVGTFNPLLVSGCVCIRYSELIPLQQQIVSTLPQSMSTILVKRPRYYQMYILGNYFVVSSSIKNLFTTQRGEESGATGKGYN